MPRTHFLQTLLLTAPCGSFYFEPLFKQDLFLSVSSLHFFCGVRLHAPCGPQWLAVGEGQHPLQGPLHVVESSDVVSLPFMLPVPTVRQRCRATRSQALTTHGPPAPRGTRPLPHQLHVCRVILAKGTRCSGRRRCSSLPLPDGTWSLKH